MSDLKLDGVREQVAFLMDNIPQTRNDYLYLLLSYWQVFDDIQIPEQVVKEIIQKATQPETISRSRRKVIEAARLKQLLELKEWAESEKENKSNEGDSE